MYKWRKTLSFLMALALLASSSPAVTGMLADGTSALAIQASAAKTYVDESGLVYSEYSGYVEIKGYEGESTVVEIPSVIDDLPVTRIANGAFADSSFSSLEEITIPDSIEFVGANAFAGCTNVKTGYIPTKFIAICAAAKKIEVSENITELLSFEIESNAKTKVTIPDGLASIYTDYTIDGTSLSKRNIAVPAEVSQADISSLTKAKLESFVDKYSTIEDVVFYNKDCVIPDGAVTVKATIHGYRVSTANTYAKANNLKFEPLDGYEDAETIKNNIKLKVAHTESTAKKFKFDVTADTNDYSVLQIGVVYDKKSTLTAETAAEWLTLDNEDDNVQIAKASKKSSYSGTIAENGNGLWAVGFVVVDDGSGNKVVKYGEPEYVFSETTVKNAISVNMTTKEGVNDKGLNCIYVAAEADGANYDYAGCGVVFDRSGELTEETAADQLTIDFESATSKTYTDNSFNVTITDKGYGVWVRSYVVVNVNGTEVYKYSEPVYWQDVDPLEDVSVTLENKAFSATTFDFSVKADAGENEIVNTGIIMTVNGGLSEDTAPDALTLDSDFVNKKVVGKAASSFVGRIADLGNGIWCVGYTTVKINGKEYTKYTEPVNVYSTELLEGTAVTMTARELKNTDVETYRFDVTSRTDGQIVKTGALADKSGTIKNAEEAKKKLVLGGSAPLVGVDTDETYAVSVTNPDKKGVWIVGYAVSKDAEGKETTVYTDPVFVNSSDDVAKANFSVSIVSSYLDEPLNSGETGKCRLDATSSAGDHVIKATGIIMDKTASIKSIAEAAKVLTLDDTSLNSKRSGSTGEKNSFAVSVGLTGNGCWAVGYAVIEIDGKEIVKYTDPIRVEEKAN